MVTASNDPKASSGPRPSDAATPEKATRRDGAWLPSRFLRAGAAVGAALLVFKFAGLLQSIAVGRYLPKAAGDIYVFAFENCVFALFLLGDGIIGPALMPVFMREASSGPDGERRAWKNASAFLTWQFLVLAVLVALLAAFPAFFVSLLTSWTPESNPDKFALAASTVRRLAPSLLGLSLGSTTYTLLNARKRFFTAALGDAAWKFTAIVALLLFAHGSADPASVLISGLVAGSVAKLALHFAGLGRDAMRLRPTLRFEGGFPRAFAVLAWPLAMGVVFALVRDNLNNVYFPSLLTDGMMQANSWGSKLEKVLVVLIPTTLSIAAFPFMCEMAAEKGAIGSFASSISRQMLALFMPLTAFVAVAALPITALVFQGGAFDHASVHRTALSMSLYTLALPAVAVETILMKAFFASRRTLPVALLGMAFSTLSVVLSWLGSRHFADREMLVLASIAGGFVLSRWLKTTALCAIFRRSERSFGGWPFALFVAKLAVASVVAALAAREVLMLVPAISPLASKGAILVRLVEAGCAAAAALAISFAVLRIREPLELLRLVRSGRKAKKTRGE